MSDRFDTCLALLLRSEGGYVNNPADPGGATDLGVTRAAWSEWLGRPVSVDEIRALTPADVAPLYHKDFWDALQCDQLAPGVDYMCFDGAVNQGPGRMAKWLQRSVAVDADGVVGPQTIAAARSLGAALLLPRLESQRWTAYRQDPDFSEFGNGWLSRLFRVLRQAQAMAIAGGAS